MDGGESKLGGRQVAAVDGPHRAKQLNYENHKMMQQLFMQGTVGLRTVSVSDGYTAGSDGVFARPIRGSGTYR